MEDPIDLSELKKQGLFSNFSDEELLSLLPYLKSYIYQPLDNIFEEDDADSYDIYFIIKGSVRILKWDTNKHFTYSLGQINEGSSFGEIAFINQTPRSSTIEVAKEAVVYSLSPETFRNASEELNLIYRKLLENIAVLSNTRVIQTSEKYIQSIRSAIEKLQITSDSANQLFEFLGSAFLVNIVFFIFLNAFSEISSYQFNFIYWVTLGGVFYFFKERLYLYWDNLGLKKELLKESIIFGLKNLAVILPSLFLLSFVYGTISNVSLGWILGLIPYVFIYEVIVRGFILQNFITFLGENKLILAIALTTLIALFMPAYTLHLTTPMIIFLSMALNLILSWMFTRIPNLGGVILVHFLALFFAKWWQII